MAKENRCRWIRERFEFRSVRVAMERKVNLNAVTSWCAAEYIEMNKLIQEEKVQIVQMFSFIRHPLYFRQYRKCGPAFPSVARSSVTVPEAVSWFTKPANEWDLRNANDSQTYLQILRSVREQRTHTFIVVWKYFPNCYRVGSHPNRRSLI